MAKKKASYLSTRDEIIRRAYGNADNDVGARLLESRQREEEAPADFSNVEGGASTFEEPAPSRLGSILDSLQASAQDSLAGMMQKGSDAEFFDQQEEAKPWYQRDLGSFIGSGPGARAQADAKLAYLLDGLVSDQSGDTTEAGAIKRLTDASAANRAGAARTLKENDAFGLETAQDVAGSATSLASALGGGMLAAIPATDAYNREYLAARQGGLDPEKAHTYAQDKMMLEFALESIPGGKVAGKLLGAGVREADTLTRVGTRIASNYLAEGANEAATTLLQTAYDKERSLLDSDAATREYASKQLPEDLGALGADMWRAFKAGGAGAGIITSPLEMHRAAAENGRRAAELIAKANQDSARRGDRKPSTAITPTAPTQEDMFGPADSGTPSLDQYTAERQAQLEAAYQQQLRERQSNNLWEQRAQQEEALRQQQIDQAYVQAEQDNLNLGNLDLASGSLAAGGNAMADALRRAGLEKIAALTSKPTVNQPQASAPVQAAPTREPVQQDMFTGQEQTDLAVQRKTSIAQRDAITKVIQKDAKDIRANALSKRAAARRSFLTDLVTQSRDMPEADRVDFLANATTQWEQSNPVENFLKEAAVPQAKGKAKKGAKKVKATQAQVASVADEMSNFINGLAQQTSNPDTGVTSGVAVKALVDRMGNGDVNKLSKLVLDNNLEIVDDVSQIPEGAAPMGAAGFYDGNKTYVVANKLDPKNIVGSMLSVAAHEVKHAADVSGKLTFGEFVGKKANDNLNKTILAAHKRGDALAVRAYNAAKAGSRSDAEFALELPAYYINEARNARSASRASVLRDALSAVRTTAKNILPGDYQVNLDDVAYLSDQLLKKAAVSGKQLSGDVNAAGQSMIYDSSASGFNEQKAAGRTYKSADGVEKFVLSDADSSLTPNAFKQFSDKNPHLVTLGKVLDHDALYEQHPELRDLEVYVDSETNMGENYAMYMSSDIGSPGYIVVRKDVATGKAEDTEHNLRAALLHEVQHAIQNKSAERAKQFFDKNKIKRPEGYDAVVENLNQNRRANDKANRNFLDKASVIKRLLPSSQSRLVDSVLYDQDMKDHQKVRTLLDYLEDAEALHDPAIDGVVRNVVRTKAEYNESAHQYNDANNTMNEYYKNITEREAFYTQAELDTPQGSLPTNPEADMRAQSPDGSLRGQTGERLESNIPGLAFIPQLNEAMKEKAEGLEFLHPAYRVIKRLLFPGGGFGAAMLEKLNHSKQLGAKLALEGDFLGNEMLRAMNSALANNQAYLAKGERWFRDTISKRIEEIDKLDTRAERNSALVSMNREFPGVGTAVLNLRNFKIKLTQDIMTMRTRDPKPLSDKERAVYTKMMQNAERYTTRAYLATYTEAVGKSYGKKLLDQYEKNPKSDEAKVVVDALNYLVANEVAIPDPETMTTLNMSKLRRLHENWIGPSTNFKGSKGKASMIKALTEFKANNALDLDAKAMEVVRDMLNQTGKGRLKNAFTPGAKQNRTILEGRTDIPVELRKLMGEITDPFLRESISLYRMTNLISKTKLLTEVAEQGKDKWYADKRSDKFNEQLNGIAYGPLDGKWISTDTSDALTGTILNYVSFDTSLAESLKEPSSLMQWAGGKVLPVSHRIMGLQKTWQVVANVSNMMLNLAGSPIMAIGQGVWNPATAAKGMKGAAAALALEVTSKYAGRDMINTASEVVLAGAVDSASMGEFKTEAFQTILKEIDKLDANDSSFMLKATKAIGKEILAKGVTANTLRQFYAFMDVWVKTATYYDRKNFLANFHKANGTEITEEELIRQAGFEAAGTNVSYERAIPLAKILERNIPFAMFLTYFSEVPRAMGMSFIQAGRDAQLAMNAKTPEARNLAATKAAMRFIGSSMITGGIIAATMVALDGEDEEEKRRRKLDAEYQQNRIMVPMGLDKDGNEKMFTINRIDPNGPLNEFIIDYLAAPEGKKAEAVLQNVKNLFVASKGWLKTYQILHDATVAQAMPEWDMKRNKNTLTQKNNPELYNRIAEFGSSLDLGENFTSAVEALLLPAVIAPVVDEDRNALGYKPYVRNPDKSLSFRVYEYKNKLKLLQKEKTEFLDRQEDMNMGQLAEKMQDLASKERDLFNGLYEAYDSYLAYPDRNRSTALDAFGTENRGLYTKISRGVFQSSILDAKSAESWYKKELAKPGADKRQVMEDYMLLRKVYLEGSK